MPQLNFYWYASQIFWLCLTFGFLYVVLLKKALPRLNDILQGRRERIADDLEAAENARIRAETLETEHTASMQNARHRAQGVIAESQSEAEKHAAERHAELDRVLHKKLAEAEATITKAKADVVTRITPISVELTQALVKKLTNMDVPKEQVEKVVSQLAKREKYVR